MNPNTERNKRLEDFFAKVEEKLAENFEVINQLLMPKGGKVIERSDVE